MPDDSLQGNGMTQCPASMAGHRSNLTATALY